MKHKLLVSMVSSVLALTFGVANANDKGAPAHWGYEGKTGPAKWGALDEANSACKLSKEQSPIDIIDSKTKKAALPALDFKYVAGSAEVINNGHTIQLNLPAGSSMKVGSDEANLLQFHFHTPSEEKINGKTYPLVAHFVHKNADGKLFVVAALFKTGKENAALAPVFSALPAEGKPNTLASFDPAAVLPENRAYYKFMGSLTTPPCSDGVRWHVLKQPVELSKAQLAAFKKMYPMNARPVQPLNGRVVEVSE
ncbi:carbonic anhydrase family protein [Undibacterium sp. TS12]|uniref:carbonic anhydrase n=1 Tax=Undibacterium sp. TS12 TaxID=2908202 RepID=UPI001F4CA217|nr:carbonic anhydrase family protein [Undibacterium sp. TS12]MCH8623027.1 carbonic anhydrase family protein [Undibacterium sp. TS12]